jgi:acetolactate synthase-1/2/3 large subunit
MHVDAWPEHKPSIALDWTRTNDRIFPRGEGAYGSLDLMLRQLLPEGSLDTVAVPAHASLCSSVADVVRPRSPAQGISPAALFHAVDQRIANDWLMTVDVGAHRILANHVLRCRTPGQLLQSNGLGCMGYALPAAIGAQLVHPERTVVAMLGDGCMLMTQGELALAAERKLPLVIVVLNDAKLVADRAEAGQMRMESARRFRIAGLAKIAAGFGADGIRVETIGQFEAAFARALAARRLTVIDAMVDPGEYREQMCSSEGESGIRNG